jgi:CRISPR-associated protein Cas1
MAWRGLHISNPARLRLKDNRVEVAQDSGTIDFPLEDVAWIVLDTNQATATATLMAACAKANVPLVISDEKHMPCGTLLPFHQYFRQGEIARLQLGATLPAKKRIWQALVRQKILNQADVLARVGAAGASELREMSRWAKSGDPDNVEARAARFYWQNLFPEFRRQDESDRRNALLNYGYAVVRAAIARGLVGHGFIPAFGLHHDSVQNAFNLADDLIEPCRPEVDHCAFRRWEATRASETRSLDKGDRQAMAAVLSASLMVGEERLPFLAAIERMVESLRRALEAGEADALELPRLAA